MSTNSKLQKYLLVTGICSALFLSGCGNEQSSSDLILNGADRFAANKKEVVYFDQEQEEIGTSIQNMADEYARLREDPAPMEIQDAQDIIENVDDDDKIDTHNGKDIYIGSDQDLKNAVQIMLDETKTVLEYELTNGYVMDVTSYGYVVEELIREDPVDGICIAYYGWVESGGNGKDSLTLEYELPLNDLKKMKTETRVLVQNAIEEMNMSSGLSDYDIVVKVNEYLCDKIVYPEADFKKYPEFGYSPQSHTAYAAFKDGYAVCDGYARAAMLLLDYYHIPCLHVRGDTNEGGHAWNLVNIDSAWYHLDVCWNDTGNDRKEFVLKSDSFMKRTRTWEASDYPVSAMDDYKS